MFILHPDVIHCNYDIISVTMHCTVGGAKGLVQRRTKAGSYWRMKDACRPSNVTESRVKQL